MELTGQAGQQAPSVSPSPVSGLGLQVNAPLPAFYFCLFVFKCAFEESNSGTSGCKLLYQLSHLLSLYQYVFKVL